jgi:hypothetical protein
MLAKLTLLYGEMYWLYAFTRISLQKYVACCEKILSCCSASVSKPGNRNGDDKYSNGSKNIYLKG